MPRVVPSQIVDLIDQHFPEAKRSPQTAVAIQAGRATALFTLLRLIDEMPPELTALSGDDYSHFAYAIEMIRITLHYWDTHDNKGDIRDMAPGWSPVAILRRALAQCPDETPSPQTASLAFVTDDVLRASIRQDVSSAFTALHNGEWKASTVLAGAAIEALLLWKIQAATDAGHARPDDAPKAPVERWSLGEYIAVAFSTGIVKDRTRIQAEQAQEFRNLIHPGRAKRTAAECTRATALAALAALDFVVEDLSAPAAA